MASLLDLFRQPASPARLPWLEGVPELDPSVSQGGSVATGMLQGIGNLATLPGRVYSGEVPVASPGGHTDPALVDRAFDAAGAMPFAGMVAGPVAGAATLTAGAAKPLLVPRTASGAPLFDLQNLTAQAPAAVPQVPLARAVPKKGGYNPVVEELLARPDVRAGVGAAIDRGVGLGAHTWYDTKPLLGAFQAELGDEAGVAAFQRFLEMTAATSTGSNVTQNIKNASYWYGLERQGAPAPAVGDPIAPGYGHKHQKDHQRSVAKLMGGSALDSVNNPKIASFTANLLGNYYPVTVDKHATRLPSMIGRDPRMLHTSYKGGKDDAARNFQAEHMRGDLTMDELLATPVAWRDAPHVQKEYTPFEEFYRAIGEERGLQGAPTQAAAWVGGGAGTGLGSAPHPFMSMVADRIARTAVDRGIPADAVLRQMIRGEQPLLASGEPATGLLALLQREPYATGGGF